MGVASTPEHIIRHPSLSVGAKATWGALSSYADSFYGEQHVWPSQDTLAKDLNVTPRCIRNWLAEIETAGLMRVIRQNTRAGRESNVYALQFPVAECQQEAHRNSGSSGVPMGSAKTKSQQEAKRKPTGSPEEAQRNAGSYEGLEGSEGLDGSEGSFAPDKPTQAALFGNEQPQQDKPKRKPKQPNDNSVKFHSVWALWEKYMIPAKHVSEKPDPRFWKPVLAGLDKYGIEKLEKVMDWHAKENAKDRYQRVFTLTQWFAQGLLPVTVQRYENAGGTHQPRQQDNRIAPDNYKEIKW